MVLSQDWSGKLVGDYHLQRRLGGGSFGEVYQAQDLREHSQVALKLIKAPITQREDLKAFLNEARSIRLRHPHIVPLLDFGLSEQDLPFLVMEYVAGGTLRDCYPKGTRVPLERVVSLTIQLASALQYAHDRHLVHRDVKPENMLYRTDGTILLSDFGMASVAHASSSVSAYQAFGGTLPYMAPEQHQGHPRLASDQYALAVVVYEWLAGTRPFQGTVPELMAQHLHTPPPSLLEQVPTLSAEVEQVVFKALSKHPLERFARVDDFADALQTASQPPVAPPSPDSFSPPPTASSGWKQPMPDQATKAGQTRESLSPSPAVPPLPESRTRANQPAPREIPLTIPSSARTIPSEGGPSIHTPRSPALVPRPAQHRSILNRRVLFAFGLVLLVVLSGGGLLYFGFGVQRVLTLSPVQVAAATATAAQPTQQDPTTRAMAAQNTVLNSKPLLVDNLTSDKTNRWTVDGTHCTFNTGEYYVTVPQPNYLQYCPLLQPSVNNTAAQVDVTLLTSNSAGMLFRLSGDQFYDFEITNQNQFFFRRHDVGATSNAYYFYLIKNTHSSAILPAGQKNTLFIIANGNDFRLYINGSFVGEAQDSNYSSGQLALAAGTPDTAPTAQAKFTNFKLFQAPSA